ncbi:MAG: flagellar hook-associated protein FlgK [Balneolaceae bacterium]|nr:flagellar hook-associated protein FlgK [Balneolaceae bacterium]
MAKNGLLSSQKASGVVSHNIANANTPGYTRQRAELSEQIHRQGGFTLGRGVTIAQVKRLRNNLIDEQIMMKEHELGDLNERNRIYQQIEGAMVTTTGDGLDVGITDFFNSFSELSNNPQDINLRHNVLSNARTLISKFKDMGSDMKDIDEQTLAAARNRVDKVNTLLGQLADINADIARAEATGQPDLNSKDRQLELLKTLSSQITVEARYQNDGTLEARVGGVTVLSGTETATLRPEVDTENRVFRVRLDNGKLLDIGRGELGADAHMFEEVVPGVRNTLDKIANSVVEQVNALHINGYGVADNGQRNFFDPAGDTAESIALNQTIVDNPEHIATSSVAGEAGNNDNALQIANLQNLSLLDGESLASNAVQMMTDPGMRITELENRITSRESARQLLINQQESQSGVNIDEELSDLIKYQNAYQASARVLNEGQKMYDTLLSIL